MCVRITFSFTLLHHQHCCDIVYNTLRYNLREVRQPFHEVRFKMCFFFELVQNFEGNSLTATSILQFKEFIRRLCSSFIIKELCSYSTPNMRQIDQIKKKKIKKKFLKKLKNEFSK